VKIAHALAFLSLASAAALAAASAAESPARPNILFIAVDDLRPSLGCYGDSLVKSPQIDRLAASGLIFRRAYCQQAICSPSRNSLLTGLRPDTIKIYDLPTHFRTKVPDAITLPEYFKSHGYTTERYGKIFHMTHGNYDDVRSWTRMGDKGRIKTPSPATPSGDSAKANGAAGGVANPPKKQRRGPAFKAPEVDDDALADGRLAKTAVERLRVLKESGAPFFLAVGFARPHLPFIAPKKYWDLYDPSQIPLPSEQTLPKDAPRWAGAYVGELAQYAGVPKARPLPADYVRKARHGYFAAVSYMDAQVGRLLDALDALQLTENTVVILWGDHGYQLGEHGQWCKHNNYELSTHVPLIIRAPGSTKAGTSSDAFVELIDVYPSLAELAHLPQPDGMEGTSFVPLFKEPQRAWKSATFSQWPKKIPGHGTGMGHAIRTTRYRYVEWTGNNAEVVASELYDYENDPGETANIAEQPANKELVARLAEQLRAGWAAAVPK
jgi:iduronate 2-sulfatase